MAPNIAKVAPKLVCFNMNVRVCYNYKHNKKPTCESNFKRSHFQ